MADRHLREFHLARERGDALLVLRIPVGVHEDNRDGLDAVGHCAFEFGADRSEIQLTFDRAVGPHALVDFHHALEQHFRLDDMLGKNIRPGLVANA